MNRPAFLAALLVAGLAAAAASARDRGGFVLDFDALDPDGTGAVDRAALEAFGRDRLALLDTDGDGALSREELAAAMPPAPGAALMPFARDPRRARADRLLARFEAEAAGAIAIEDLVRRQVDLIFARLDRNGDGVLTREEAEAPLARRAERGDGRHGMRRGMRGPGDGPRRN